MSARIRVLLAVRGPYLAQFLIARITAEPHLDVVAHVRDGDALLDEIRRAQPHVAVLDFDLLPPRALPLVRNIRSLWPAMRIVLLVDDDTSEYREAAAAVGADACIEKRAALPALIEAIQGLCLA